MMASTSSAATSSALPPCWQARPWPRTIVMHRVKIWPFKSTIYLTEGDSWHHRLCISRSSILARRKFLWSRRLSRRSWFPWTGKLSTAHLVEAGANFPSSFFCRHRRARLPCAAQIARKWLPIASSCERTWSSSKAASTNSLPTRAVRELPERTPHPAERSLLDCLIDHCKSTTPERGIGRSRTVL